MPAGTQVVVATKPVDFRKGPESLMALVRDGGADPFSDAFFVFRAKQADHMKIVRSDGTGLCLLVKRLAEGGFCLPRIEDHVILPMPVQLMALVEGIDRTRARARRERRARLARLRAAAQ